MGPEESGPGSQGPVGFWGFGTVSSRSRPHWLVLVWWVAGAGSHQTVGVGVLLLGVLFPWGGMVMRQVVVLLGWLSCPYFENCIVDASISL